MVTSHVEGVLVVYIRPSGQIGGMLLSHTILKSTFLRIHSSFDQ